MGFNHFAWYTQDNKFHNGLPEINTNLFQGRDRHVAIHLLR